MRSGWNLHLLLGVGLTGAVQKLDLPASISSATADPYRPDLFWWLGNCPATKCYDGDTGALATQNCGSNTTNLCHTGYVDQVHTLTYEFTGSYFVEMVTIYNKPG